MDPTPTSPRNLLLSRLSDGALGRLSGRLELIRWKFGDVVYDTGAVEQSVYFPIDSIVALLQGTLGGTTAEISLVGNDGLVGFAALLGGESTPSRAIVQRAGHAYRLRTVWLRQEIRDHDELLALGLRYAQALMTQMGLTAACNRHHSIKQQLSRLLLLCLDRIPADELVLTHQAIAEMLGVRREAVTMAVADLRRRGILVCGRGWLRVKNRSALEHTSCECYAALRREMDRLLPVPRNPVGGWPKPPGRSMRHGSSSTSTRRRLID